MEKELSWIDQRPTLGSLLNEDNLLRDYARISSRRRGAAVATARRAQSTRSVSYTHLTLPTKA